VSQVLCIRHDSPTDGSNGSYLMELEDFRSINRTDTSARCVCGRLLDYKSNLAKVVNTVRPIWKHMKTLPFEYM